MGSHEPKPSEISEESPQAFQCLTCRLALEYRPANERASRYLGCARCVHLNAFLWGWTIGGDRIAAVVAGSIYLPLWPAFTDHEHAERAPTPGELIAASGRAYDRLMDAWTR